MIPTLILVGLVFGRWWRVVIPVAAVAWPALAIADDAGPHLAAGAALLAAINTAVGVLVVQLMRATVVLPVRWVRHRTS